MPRVRIYVKELRESACPATERTNRRAGCSYRPRCAQRLVLAWFLAVLRMCVVVHHSEDTVCVYGSLRSLRTGVLRWGERAEPKRQCVSSAIVGGSHLRPSVGVAVVRLCMGGCKSTARWNPADREVAGNAGNAEVNRSTVPH